MFKEVVRLTPADYIRKRRLSEIAKRICEGKMHISELAFRYGFNSKENFIRAFKAEHHILPYEFKTASNSLKLYDRYTFETKSFEIKPQIVNSDSFSLTGFDSDEDYAPNFWNKYNAHKLSKRLSGGKTVADYGVCIWNDAHERMQYFIGIRTHEAVEGLSGTRRLEIGGGLYAAFDTPTTGHADFVNCVHRTWAYINSEWLPNSGYRRAYRYEFETYVEESRTFSERIFIPIEEEAKLKNLTSHGKALRTARDICFRLQRPCPAQSKPAHIKNWQRTSSR